MLALRLYNSNTDAVEALDTWCALENRENVTSWQQQYPVHENVDEAKIKALYKKHVEWTQLADIEGKPSFFINGMLFPWPLFRLSDIRYYLREKLD